MFQVQVERKRDSGWYMSSYIEKLYLVLWHLPCRYLYTLEILILHY